MAKLCPCCVKEPPDSQETPTSLQLPTQQVATTDDLKSFLQKFNDIRQLDDLIQLIEELLKITLEEKSDEGSVLAVNSYIQDGQTILEIADKNIGKLRETRDFTNDASAEARKVVTDLLKGAGRIHLLGAALSVLGFVLARYCQMKNNKQECLDLLEVMVNLAKQILDLNEQMPNEEMKLNKAVRSIVLGCIMCVSQLARENFFRFLTASVNNESLKGLRVKLDFLYKDVQLATTIDLQKRVKRIASQSPKLYLQELAVGIERGRKTVARLLDLNAQDTSALAVVVHGPSGIGKTTIADDVYARIDLTAYKYCRIYIDENFLENDLKGVQEQILQLLFEANIRLLNCDEGRGRLRSFFKKTPNQPLFLYIDNGLKFSFLKRLLPPDLGSCLPFRSRMLVTTRNLQETDILIGWKLKRRHYLLQPLPPKDARKILLKNVVDYNDEIAIETFLRECRGIPFKLEIANGQLVEEHGKSMVEFVSQIEEGTEVEDEDTSGNLVDFVYQRLPPPVQEALLDITSFFFNWQSKQVAYIVGEEEFTDLEKASLISTSENGNVVVHDIVRGRVKKLSEQTRITNPETLLDILKDEEKLRNLKGVFLSEEYEKTPIEINKNHLDCMTNSIRVLVYKGSHITFKEKCQKPFEQLRYLGIPSGVPDLPMEIDKLPHLSVYSGPFTQGMSLYEFPPNLRDIKIYGSSENGVAYSETLPKFNQVSSLVNLALHNFVYMRELPDGVETLTKLEVLYIMDCPQLSNLTSNFEELRNLQELKIGECHKLNKLHSSFEQLPNLKSLDLSDCSALSELPSSIGNLTSLNNLQLNYCSGLEMLPSTFGQLENLEELSLSYSGLKEWPSNFRDLTKMKKMNLVGCSSTLRETVPSNIKENCTIQFDYYC